jgi:hypothetical protein
MLPAVGRPKSEIQRVNVSGRVPKEHAEALERIAAAEQRTVSQLVAFAVEAWLAARASPSPSRIKGASAGRRAGGA